MFTIVVLKSSSNLANSLLELIKEYKQPLLRELNEFFIEDEASLDFVLNLFVKEKVKIDYVLDDDDF